MRDAGGVTEPTPPAFPAGMNKMVEHASGEAVFGLDVLDKLVASLEKAAAVPRTSRSWGPGVLGCAMWMDDPALLEVLGRMANVCVVVRKQSGARWNEEDTVPLKTLAASTGLAQQAFPELSELAPRRDGAPAVVGPFGGVWDDNVIDAVREVGFRRVGGGNRLVPIVHAKLMLVGEMWWHDEHPAGGVEDIIGFRPTRLWAGSANFTKSSRSSLEMGMWTTDPAMLAAARSWLLSLVEMSEPAGAGSDDLEPELVPVEYDEDGIREYLAEAGWFVEEDD